VERLWSELRQVGLEPGRVVCVEAWEWAGQDDNESSTSSSAGFEGAAEITESKWSHIVQAVGNRPSKFSKF